MLRFGLIALVASSIFLISGCEDDKKSKLFKAQICLDKASPGDEAAACYEPIINETSKRAYVIICSARFLERGLDDAKIVAALKEISDDNGTDPTSTAISNLAFPDSATTPTSYDVQFARDTFNNFCVNTESDGLIALSSFAVISTATAFLVDSLAIPGCTGGQLSVDCVKQGLENLDESAETGIIGETALENREVLCGENGLFKDEQLCTDINDAIEKPGNTTNDQIGDSLLCLIDAENQAERDACP